MHKDAGRPWPVICPEDDVIDYMVMEAVSIRVAREDAEAMKEAEESKAREDFKKDTSDLEQFRNKVTT